MGRTTALLILGVVVGTGMVMVLTAGGPGDVPTETPAPTATEPAPATDTRTTDGGTATVEPTATATATQTPQPVTDAVLETAIRNAIASERRAADVDRLNRTERLDRVADHHSEEMATYDFFADESPWGDTLQNRFVQEDVACSRVFDEERAEYVDPAQLIYRTNATTNASSIAEAAVATWLAEADDERALSLDGWTELGVGVERASDGEELVYVTVVFC
jgi:uncharacterized protein YkwD